MIKHFIISFLIFLFVVMPVSILAIPCLAIALLTDWSGTSHFFGNCKWGKATSHYLASTDNKYWKELSWLGLRNPIYNFKLWTLGVIMLPSYHFFGDDNIGDKLAGGSYKILMGKFWEYYYIKPYTIFGSKRCIRLRFGWKLKNNMFAKAEFVFAFNPWKRYEGA